MVKSILKFAMGVGIAAFFLWLAFRGIDLSLVYQAIRGANYLWFLLVVPLFIMNVVVRAWRWNMLLYPVRKKIPLSFTTFSTFICYLVNNALPRAGEIARCANLARLTKIPFSSILATVAVERVIDMLFMLLMMAIALIFYRDQIRSFSPGMEGALYILLIISLVIVGFFLFITIRPERIIGYTESLLGRISGRLKEKVLEQMRAFIDGLKVMKYTGKYTGVILTSLLINVIYILSVYFAFYIFHLVENYHLSILSALAVNAVGALGFVIPAPGGTGTFHYFCSRSLIWIFNVSPVIASSFATVVWVAIIITYSLFGALSFGLQWLFIKNPPYPPFCKGGNQNPPLSPLFQRGE